jgi:hypothetical protein
VKFGGKCKLILEVIVRIFSNAKICAFGDKWKQMLTDLEVNIDRILWKFFENKTPIFSEVNAMDFAIKNYKFSN